MSWFQRKDKGILTPTEKENDTPDGLRTKTPSAKGHAAPSAAT